MCKQVPTYIEEICPECHPQSFDKTLAKFVGEVEEITIIVDSNTKVFTNKYLYECCKCGTKMWVDEQWVKNNSIDESQVEQSKTIEQRNEYIHNKMIQLDQVRDARKHTKRLARIMKYHKVLTDVEVSSMRQRLQIAFKGVPLKGSEDT